MPNSSLSVVICDILSKDKVSTVYLVCIDAANLEVSAKHQLKL